VDFPDIWKSNESEDIQFQCESSLTLCILSPGQLHKIQVFINKCLRRILNIHWPERIIIKELLKKMSEQPVLEQFQRRKWNWIGHTLRH